MKLQPDKFYYYAKESDLYVCLAVGSVTSFFARPEGGGLWQFYNHDMYKTKWSQKLHPTTANVRFRLLKTIFTQIAKQLRTFANVVRNARFENNLL